MARQKGTPHGFKHQVATLLTDEGLKHFTQSKQWLNVGTAEALRQAVELQYITLSSQNPTDATIQSIDTGEQTP